MMTSFIPGCPTFMLVLPSDIGYEANTQVSEEISL